MNELTEQLRGKSVAQRLGIMGWLIIIALVPFHGFISTWGGTTIGPLSIWKVYKDILLVLVLLPVLWLLIKQRSLRTEVVRSWLFRLIALYVILHVVATALFFNGVQATVYGLAINMRIPLFFAAGYILFHNIKLSSKGVKLIIMVPATLVLIFGMLQMFVLPHDFLSLFGYEKGVTIAPVMNIDEQPDQLRFSSTLRGPNPLGAYLILPGMILLSLLMHQVLKTKKKRLVLLLQDSFGYKRLVPAFILMIMLLILLYGTHSRAAWAGFLLSGFAWVLLSASKQIRRLLYATIIIGAVVFGAGLYQLRSSAFIQTVILHDNPETGAEVTSNDAHSKSIENGIKQVSRRPLTGCGPGCAGPASFYNNDGGNLAENYYIQIAQEVGVFGLLLYLAIGSIVAYRLYVIRKDAMAVVLLSSFIGLSAANLLLHVWADETIAYVWWGSAGLLMAQYFKQESKQLPK